MSILVVINWNLLPDKINRRSKTKTAEPLYDRANKQRGYVPPMKGSSELEYTVPPTGGKRWFRIYRGYVPPQRGRRWIIRYEASFNHCQAIGLRESETFVFRRWKAPNSFDMAPMWKCWK